MADTLERTSPLQPWAARFGQLPNSVAIVEEPFVTMVDLRVNPSGPGAAAAMNTVPTGLASVPPSGPAMPVTAIPQAEPEIRQIPAAMASATGALTAPCARKSSSGTPRRSSLAWFE